MKHGLSNFSFILAGLNLATKRLCEKVRGSVAIGLLCLGILAFAAIYLDSAASAHGWSWKSWRQFLSDATDAPSETSRIPRPYASPQVATSSSSYTITSYDATGAGTAAGHGTVGIAIDAAGDIAGLYLDSNGATHGFERAASGAITNFDATGAGTASTQGTFALSMDPGGNYITGMFADSGNSYHGYVRAANGTITEFDVSGAGTGGHRGTIPLSINSGGIIAGIYTTGTYQNGTTFYHGFMRAANGTITTFDAPGAGTNTAQGTAPSAINASGTITGTYADSSGAEHGFIRDTSGTFTSFDAPGAGTSGNGIGLKSEGTIPVSIDSAGDISGVYTDVSNQHHGFVRAASGTFTTFDAPGVGAPTLAMLQGTIPFAIDPGGNYVVGLYADANGVFHGFERNASGTIASFDAPSAGTAGNQGTGGLGINANGDIAGAYFDGNTVLHGFVLVPNPQAAAPTFSVPAGTYTAAQTVSIIDTTPDPIIYYTTDGTTPTTSSDVYSAPLTVSQTETIKAIATATGYSASAIASATYTINLPQNPVPSLGNTSPTFVSAGGSSFTLTVNGSGFTGSSVVNWGTSALATQFVSGTQLTATVPASDIASAGIFTVSVQTPGPGGGTSNTWQFEVDSSGSGTSTGPTFTTLKATVAAGSTASYPVTLPSTATNVSAKCLNLPSGATCSYSSGALTIATSATTPAGTYPITVVFTETLPGAATAFLVLPILLIPIMLMRRRMMTRNDWLTACAGLLLFTVAVSTGCGSGKSTPTQPQTHTVTVSAVITLVVQ